MMTNVSRMFTIVAVYMIKSIIVAQGILTHKNSSHLKELW